MRHLSLIFSFLALVYSQVPSPCEDVLKYEPRDVKNSDRWHAVLSYKTKETLEGVWLRIELDNQADALINWFGEVSTQNDINYLIKNADYRLSAGKTLTVKFAVKYNTAKTIPSVKRIKLNGVVICPIQEPPVPEPTAAPIQPSALPSSTGHVSIGDIFPAQNENILIRFSSGNCGSVPLKGRPLVYHGEKSEEGRWPWHLAIQKLSGASLAYSCGGTLISDSFALTAAHCVVRLPGKTPLNPQLFLIQLGTNDLKNEGIGQQNLQALEIFVHPGFEPKRYYNDIALIKFIRKVTFSDYVQPVCLWEGSDDTSSIEGKLGTVVGWGIDENNKTTTELMETKLPIVGLSTCIYSNREFYSQYTSETTFCAGYTNGTTVCRGDSGGGMVFPKTDVPGKEIWQLRGIVSVSPNPGTRTCATDSYVVFTDVAKHQSWIKTTANIG